jgi:hypothetical protein
MFPGLINEIFQYSNEYYFIKYFNLECNYNKIDSFIKHFEKMKYVLFILKEPTRDMPLLIFDKFIPLINVKKKYNIDVLKYNDND